MFKSNSFRTPQMMDASAKSHPIDPTEERLDAFLDTMHEALLEIGLDNTILRVNKSLERLLGVGESSLIGKSALEFVSTKFLPLNPDRQAGILEALEKSYGVVSGHCKFLDTDGRELYLGWVLSPLEFDGATRGRLLALLDLTAHRDLQTALMQQREDFLAVLNHRLRTPILATQRIIQLLLEGQFGKLNDKQEEVIALLSDNIGEVNRLMVMIMDIYQYRSATKQLSIKEVRIGPLLESVLAKKHPRKVELEIRLSNPEARLCCDDGEISKLLSHVIDNAVRYARSKVKVTVEETNKEDLLIQVQDDGKGLAKEDIKGLFDRFFVVSASGRYAPVTGAGLCLCAEIARSHGGTISCESESGAGACFSIRLPLCARNTDQCKQ